MNTGKSKAGTVYLFDVNISRSLGTICELNPVRFDLDPGCGKLNLQPGPSGTRLA
jgi:hypothetical protein